MSSSYLAIRSHPYFGSGDDHSPCLYEHEYLKPDTGENDVPVAVKVPEYTIATFSWLQGEPQPEFGLLSLDDRHLSLEICNLPNQLQIYKTYAALAAVSAVAVIFWSVLLTFKRRRTVGLLPINFLSAAAPSVRVPTTVTTTGLRMAKELVVAVCLTYGLLTLIVIVL